MGTILNSCILAFAMVASVAPSAAAEPISVNATGDSESDAVAVSGTGNATCSGESLCVSASGTGNATSPLVALSGTGNASSTEVLVSTGGCAWFPPCPSFAFGFAASGTGNATCPYSGDVNLCVPVSATGHAPGGVSACDVLTMQGRPEACVDSAIERAPSGGGLTR